MSKSADAFRTISEVAEWLDTPAHVLRFWESKFTQVKPVKRAGGRRYYRPADMRLLGGIKKLLHEDGMTIKGVQKILREQGIKHVSSLCALSVGDEDDYEDAVLHEVTASDPVDTVVPFAKPAEPEREPESEDIAETDRSGSDADEDALQSHDLTELEGAEEEPVAAESPAGPEVEAPEPVPEVAEHSDADTAEVEMSEAVVDIEPVAASDETNAAAESDPEPDPKPQDSDNALPGFLKRSMHDRLETADAPEGALSPPEPEAPAESVPRAEPSEPEPGALTYLSRITRLDAETARKIAPILEQLRSRAG